MFCIGEKMDKEFWVINQNMETPRFFYEIDFVNNEPSAKLYYSYYSLQNSNGISITPKDENQQLFIDTHCRSKEDFIDTHCRSKEDFFNVVMRSGGLGDDEEHVEQLKSLKRKRDGLIQQFLNGGNIEEKDYRYFSSICAAFNIEALALLSLPAYAAIDFDFGFVPFPLRRMGFSNDDLFIHYQPCDIPTADKFGVISYGDRANTFEEFYHAFIEGNFIYNNSETFLYLYGLAQAITTWVKQIKWESMNYKSFDGVLLYKPLVTVLNKLVEIGALDNPFETGKGGFRHFNKLGIFNAEEVNENMAAVLTLIDAFSPSRILLTMYVQNHEVFKVFYGLIDIFSMRKYFGIDEKIEFKY